jgi:16S rRNA (adenine1518-N6/adenine1519-N6)-dimethyltransferase
MPSAPPPQKLLSLLTSPEHLRTLFKKHAFKPQRWRGQHFLINSSVLNSIIRAAEILPGDNILEVGAGVGALTIALALRAKKVYAVENDVALCSILKTTTSHCANVSLLCQDILSLSPKQLPASFRIVANLPYYLTSPFLRRFAWESKPAPQRFTVLVQKEIAHRIVARPPRMNLLGVVMQLFGHPRIVLTIPPSAFWPRPRVTSALLDIRRRPSFARTLGPPLKRKLLLAIVQAAFRHRRKRLLKNFLAQWPELGSAALSRWLKQSGVAATKRAQELDIAAWLSLVKNAPPALRRRQFSSRRA